MPIIDLEASSGKLAVNELAKIVPALGGYELQPAFEARANGPADRLAVDVAQIDRLLLGDGRLAGRFTGDATISGTTSSPRVSSEFTLSQGAFRDFRFESLMGTVEYAGSGVDMDVRLQQTPTAWITAKGHAPLTLFRANPPGTAEHDVESAGGAVDVQIASSEIDLGIVQEFTSYVTNVTGRMQANVRPTGIRVRSAPRRRHRRPRRSVCDSGPWHRLYGPRHAHRAEAGRGQHSGVQDPRQPRLPDDGWRNAGGARALGRAVNVRVQSENFEVIDNELADLKLDTELRITGELRRPRIEGLVEAENGTIHVARVVERATSDPYAVTRSTLPAPTRPRGRPPPRRRAPSRPRSRTCSMPWSWTWRSASRATWCCAAATSGRRTHRSRSATWS